MFAGFQFTTFRTTSYSFDSPIAFPCWPSRMTGDGPATGRCESTVVLEPRTEGLAPRVPCLPSSVATAAKRRLKEYLRIVQED